MHEILRLETAHIDPKECPYNCTTDTPKPHQQRRGEILKQVSDTGQVFVLELWIHTVLLSHNIPTYIHIAQEQQIQQGKTPSCSSCSDSGVFNSALRHYSYREESPASFGKVNKWSFWHFRKGFRTSQRTIPLNTFTFSLLLLPLLALALLLLLNSSPEYSINHSTDQVSQTAVTYMR